MLFPPQASGIFSYVPQNSWASDLSTTSKFILASSWNNFEDDKYRNAFSSSFDPVGNPTGAVEWLTKKYTDGKSFATPSEHNPIATDLLYNSDIAGTKQYKTRSILSTKFYNQSSLMAGGYIRNVDKINEYTKKSLGLLGAFQVSVLRLAFDAQDEVQKYWAYNDKITNSNTASSLPTSINPLSSNYLTTTGSINISIVFREYVHYVGNPLGGTGLIDLTPFTINATTYIERDKKIKIYSPYGNPELIDYSNTNVPFIRPWPKTLFTFT